MSGEDFAFRAHDVSRSYPGVQALKDVSLEGHHGEVLAICGANGAGKSTLARLLSGQEPPSSGTIEVAGAKGPIHDPASADRAGVLLMHQEPLIIEDFTIGENVWLHELRGARSWPWSARRTARDARTKDALERVGLGEVPVDRLASELAPGQRQMLALSRSIVTPHQILILDETTASTTEAYFEQVVEMVDQEKKAGTSVVFVSHRMGEIFALADRIAVLRNGELVDVVPASETDAEDLTEKMIGNAVKAVSRPPAVKAQDEREALLHVEGLASGSASEVSFDVAPGEILGIYGLVGSGRSSVARAISGQQPRDAGSVSVAGNDANGETPIKALRRGIAYATEDRRREGFIADFDNRANLTLVTMRSLAREGVINRRAVSRRAKELIQRYGVKGGPDTMTSALSGGNQQKVCIAKWLDADPDVLVLDEPTKGIDVGARATIYELVYGLAERRKALVVVSSEAEEILLLSHRVLVMRGGHVVSEHDSAHAATDDLVRDALGVT